MANRQVCSVGGAEAKDPKVIAMQFDSTTTTHVLRRRMVDLVHIAPIFACISSHPACMRRCMNRDKSGVLNDRNFCQ